MVKVNEIVKETASAGASSAGAVASVANPGAKPSKNKKNKNGTVKNALDSDGSIFAGVAQKR